MSASTSFEPVARMSRQEYRAWAEQQSAGRFERVNGVVVAMAPARTVDNRRKALVWQVLCQTVQIAVTPCDVCTDGMTVEVEDSDYEPDAIVHCGDRLPDDAVTVPDPLIIGGRPIAQHERQRSRLETPRVFQATLTAPLPDCLGRQATDRTSPTR